MNSKEGAVCGEFSAPSLRERGTARKSTNTEAQMKKSTKRKTVRKSTRYSKSNQNISDHFLENFDSQRSVREKTKLNRKVNSHIKRPAGAVYDESGIHINTGLDLCDCLTEACVGCFIPCPKCSSQKCGTHCRNHRKFIIEQMEFNGFDNAIIRNPLL